MILPWFGGAASVWIVCMLFFQLVLLGGYIYAHWLINNLKPSRQISTHVALLALSILVLPIAPNRHLMSGQLDPSMYLLLLLLTSVGAPYFLLSTTTPLLQSWFSKSYQQAITNEGDDDEEIYGSDWVLMTSTRNLSEVPEIRKVAVDLRSRKGLRVWTDDYSNLVQILKINKD